MRSAGALVKVSISSFLCFMLTSQLYIFAAPLDNMQKVLNDTVEEARQKVSKKHFENNKLVTNEDVKDALSILKGAVTIVYPMGLPPHDPIQAEFDNEEDLSGTQVSFISLDFSAHH